MHVSSSTKINCSGDKIWNTLRSFDGVERYLPIVTKSVVEGQGQGAKRICNVTMGTQIFQIYETLQVLDEANQSLIVSLDNGPIKMKGMNFKFIVNNIDEGKSELIISTNVDNPDAAGMVKSIFGMLGEGLRKLHEI